VQGKIPNPPEQACVNDPPIFYCIKQLISQLLDKISKIWWVNLKPSIRGTCMPIFRPLASLVWSENEVTAGHAAFAANPIQKWRKPS